MAGDHSRRATQASGIVTLLTDFGLSDPFVGMMKGVIWSRFEGARIVDLTHGIPPQNLLVAAFWLERSYVWFPVGTVHVVVVDPGVGTARAMVAARAQGHLFVAPDNGVIAGVVASDPNAEPRLLEPERIGLARPSSTFHGRDVFAPVGADLASGRRDLASLGEPAALEVGPILEPVRECEDGVEGRVVVVDRFGNLITNIEAPLVPTEGGSTVTVGTTAIPVLPLGASYGSVAEGELAALVNSHGTLEIAERNGNAAARLNVGPNAVAFLRQTAGKA